MRITTDENFKALCGRFATAGHELYLVGGAVRNALLGLPAGDRDICAAALPAHVLALCNDGFSVHERAYGLGTLAICSVNGTCYEYTSFRKDSYGRGGHRPQSVTFTKDITEDAKRRDFTINALYANCSGEVTDPTGLGALDLNNHLLRACTVDTMHQDALRILRMVRFSCELNFEIDHATWDAAKENVPSLATISPERIYDEFTKILLSDARYGNKNAVLAGLKSLKALGALKYIIPELLLGDGFLQSAKYHKYDVLNHAFHACAASPPDLTLRLSALLHDAAKPSAYLRDGNRNAHPKMGADMAAKALLCLRAPGNVIADVRELIAAHMFDLDNNAKPGAVRKKIAKLGRARFLKLIELRKADFLGSGMGNEPESAVKWFEILNQMEKEDAPTDLKALNFTGNDVMETLGIPPGPIIGKILDALLMIAVKKPSQNDYKKLTRYAKIIYNGIKGKQAAENGAEDPSGV